MATIKQLSKIIDLTPKSQAILLVGGHGIGKSKLVEDIMSKKGYRVATLFLGQAADAGDIIGLPTRLEKEITLTRTNEAGEIETYTEIVNVTDFAPPKWWPLDPNEKVAIFLDELNRGKPEIMQCVMDMVLNRKLNGRSLPSETRIFGAMNPMRDGYYQVEDLDPAMIDRWNVYEFRPEVSEWIDWATSANLNRLVIGFISSNNAFLDPSKDAKGEDVQPSRRSWHRVSDIMDLMELANGKKSGFSYDLQDMITGVVGAGAAAKFMAYIKEIGTGLTPGQILTGWNEKIQATVKKMDIREVINMNDSLCNYLRDNVKLLKDNVDGIGEKMSKNLEFYVNSVDKEAMAQFFDIMQEANRKKEPWCAYVMKYNRDLGASFLEVMRKPKKAV